MSLSRLLTDVVTRGERTVLACSALKHEYRERLRRAAHDALAIRFVYLDVPSRGSPRTRLAGRPDHYAPAALLASQLATLEPPRDALCCRRNRVGARNRRDHSHRIRDLK